MASVTQYTNFKNYTKKDLFVIIAGTNNIGDNKLQGLCFSVKRFKTFLKQQQTWRESEMKQFLS